MTQRLFLELNLQKRRACNFRFPAIELRLLAKLADLGGELPCLLTKRGNELGKGLVADFESDIRHGEVSLQQKGVCFRDPEAGLRLFGR